AIVQTECDSGLRLLLAPFELEAQLKKKKFFKDQPDMGRSAEGLQVLKALAGIGPVDLAERILWRDQAHVAANGGWDRVRELRGKNFPDAQNDAERTAGGHARQL